MTDPPVDYNSHQQDLYETDGVRSLLDQLLEDSWLYTRSKDFKDLLDFVVRLRNFAPFNAMLLQVQKPGLRYAATARDWRQGEMGSSLWLTVVSSLKPVQFVFTYRKTECYLAAESATKSR
jgi:hypothetical protein